MTMAARSVTWLIGDMAEGERESFIVASLRDTLPTKLISGELWVKDAERFIGECT
jgi:hypothetical protein